MRYLLLCFIVMLASCSSKTLMEQVDAHPDYDVSQLKTFTWDDPAVNVVGLLSGAENSQITRRAQSAADMVLKNRGYTDSGPHRPDMIASVLIGAITQTSFSSHAVQRQGYDDRTFVWNQENDYLRGGLAIILTHPDNGDIIWQGSVAENLKNDNRRAAGTINKFARLIQEMLPTAR